MDFIIKHFPVCLRPAATISYICRTLRQTVQRICLVYPWLLDYKLNLDEHEATFAREEVKEGLSGEVTL